MDDSGGLSLIEFVRLAAESLRNEQTRPTHIRDLPAEQQALLVRAYKADVNDVVILVRPGTRQVEIPVLVDPTDSAPTVEMTTRVVRLDCWRSSYGYTLMAGYDPDTRTAFMSDKKVM